MDFEYDDASWSVSSFLSFLLLLLLLEFHLISSSFDLYVTESHVGIHVLLRVARCTEYMEKVAYEWRS